MLAVPASPSMAPRVKPEAQEYYTKNQGTMGRFFDQSANRNYNSPRPGTRCPSAAAREQSEKHRGQLGNWLDESKNTNYASPRPAVRCPSAAAKDQYEKNKGCVGSTMGGYPSMAPEHRIHPRSVKPEAGSIAAGHNGSSTKKLFTDYGQMPLSARPPPRVKSEAGSNFDKNKGSMSTIFCDSGINRPSPRPDARVKPEGSGNADLNKGSRAAKILGMAPPSART